MFRMSDLNWNYKQKQPDVFQIRPLTKMGIAGGRLENYLPLKKVGVNAELIALHLRSNSVNICFKLCCLYTTVYLYSF